MNQKHRHSKLIYAFAVAGQLGFSIILPLAGFIFLGVLLDKKLNTFPNFIIVGLFIGLIVAIYETNKLIKPLIK